MYAAFHLLRKFLEFNKLRVDEDGILLLQLEPCLPLCPATATIDLLAFNRLNQFLLIWLIDDHGVATGNAFEGCRVDTWTNAGDFGCDGVNGHHVADVICSQLRNGPDLVARKMDDADKGVHVAVASIEQELSQCLI